MRRSAGHSLAVLTLSVFAFADPLSAQLPAYNAPDDPAFVFLGVSPKRIANPGTLPALGLALADGIDLEGRVNAGLAVSFLPSNLVRYSLPPERYRNGRPSFWFYNTQISVATVRKSGDTPVTDLAFGLRTILIGPEPYSDPGFRNIIAGTLDRCLGEAQGVDSSTVVLQRRVGVRAAPVRDSANPARILRPHAGVPITQDTIEIIYLDARGAPIRTERVVTRRSGSGTAIEDTVRMWKVGPNTLDREVALECASRGKSRAHRAWMKDHWNDATLAISAAGGTRFTESAIGDRSSLGHSIWILGAVPIRWTKVASESGRRERVNLGQIAGQVHYIAPTGGAGTIDYTYWESGLRGLVGRPTVNGFIELTRNLSRSPVRQDRKAWAAGAEYMIAESFWLSAGVGERYSDLLDSDKDFVFLNLKWGLAREPRLSPPR